MLSRLIRGIAIGMADPIPGVSGGTIAYITGLYDQIIDRVSRFRSHPDGWRRNVLFLLPILLGLLLGIFLFAHLVDWALQRFPNQTLQCFVGLVLGGLLVLVDQGKLSLKGRSGALSMAFAAAIAALFAFIPRPELNEPIRDPSFLQGAYIFGAGAIAASAMLLPGISGSMLHLVIGSYSTYIAAIKEINTAVLAIFIAGAIVGIAVMAKAINWLFRHYYDLTQALIGGLVIGSMFAIWPWQLDMAGHLKGIGLVVIGAAMPWLMHRAYPPPSPR
jgi:putative membrane protein